MANEQSLPEVFLDLLSVLKNNVVQYVGLGIAMLVITALLMRPYLAHNCLAHIDRRIRETKDDLDKTREEYIWRDHNMRRQIEAEFARAQEMKCILHEKVLQMYGHHQSHKEYLDVFGPLSAKLRACRHEVERIHVALLKEREAGKRARFSQEARDMEVILASGTSITARVAV
uniref:Uncharacterized protein n=1 Tax=Mycena chlorophos TaxID=658473 RepID=A0ABQ0M8S2_MYCCL|nr:predicted protein [Mycena chlorophos]